MARRVVCSISMAVSLITVGFGLGQTRVASAASPLAGGWTMFSMPAHPGVPGGPNGPGTTYGRGGGMPNQLLQTRRGLVAMGLAYGQPPTEWRSTDGRNWRQVTLPVSVFRHDYVAAVAAGRSGLVAVGSAAASGVAAWFSPDGSTWHRAAATGRASVRGHMLAVAATGTGFVAVGDTVGAQPAPGKPPSQSMAVWTSSRGDRWQLVSNTGPVFRNAVASVLLHTGSGFVVLGRSTSAPGAQGQTTVWSSRDGRTWQRVAQQVGVFPVDGTEVQGAAGSNGRYVTWGFSGAGTVPHDLVWVSSDGAHWQRAAGIHFQYGLVDMIAGHGAGFVALGVRDDEPTLWSSPDGAHWVRAAGEDIFGGGYTQLGAAADWNGALVVVGTFNRPLFSPSSFPYRPTTWLWRPGRRGQGDPAWRRTDPKWFRLHVEDMPPGFHPYAGRGAGDYDIGCHLSEEAHQRPAQPQPPPSMAGPCTRAVAALGRSLPYRFRLPYGGDGDNVPSVEGFAILAHRPDAARAAFGYAAGLVSAVGLNQNKRAPEEIRHLAIGEGAVLFSVPTIQWDSAYAVVWHAAGALGAVEVLVGAPRDRETLAVTLARRQWSRWRAVQR